MAIGTQEAEQRCVNIRIEIGLFFLPFPLQDYFGLRVTPPAEAEEFCSIFLRFVEEENGVVL